MSLKALLHDLSGGLIWLLLIAIFVGIPLLFQLLICRKVKNGLARMIPLILLLIAYVSNYAGRITTVGGGMFGGLETLGFDLTDIVIYGVAFGCALGWAAFAVGNYVKKKHNKDN